MHRILDVRLDNNPLICDRCHMGALIDRARTVCFCAASEMCVCVRPKTYAQHTSPSSILSKNVTCVCSLVQLRWSHPPVCFQPESLRGARITDLISEGLDDCLEYIDDEGHDAASTSHNFLERGKCVPQRALCGFPVECVFGLLCAAGRIEAE